MERGKDGELGKNHSINGCQPDSLPLSSRGADREPFPGNEPRRVSLSVNPEPAQRSSEYQKRDHIDSGIKNDQYNADRAQASGWSREYNRTSGYSFGGELTNELEACRTLNHTGQGGALSPNCALRREREVAKTPNSFSAQSWSNEEDLNSGHFDSTMTTSTSSAITESHVLETMASIEEALSQLSEQTSRLVKALERQDVHRSEDQIKTRSNWALRYSRRVMIIANLLMGSFTFTMSVLHCFKLRGRYPVTFLAKLFGQPPFGAKILPLTGLLKLGLLNGVQESTPFFLAATMLNYDTYPWRRYGALLFSTFKSVWSSTRSYVEPQLRFANFINIVLNTLYAIIWLLNNRN